MSRVQSDASGGGLADPLFQLKHRRDQLACSQLPKRRTVALPASDVLARLSCRVAQLRLLDDRLRLDELLHVSQVAAEVAPAELRHGNSDRRIPQGRRGAAPGVELAYRE